MKRVAGRVSKLERALDLRRGGPCRCPNGAGVEIVYEDIAADVGAKDAPEDGDVGIAQPRTDLPLPLCPRCGRERTRITVRYVPEGVLVQPLSSR